MRMTMTVTIASLTVSLLAGSAVAVSAQEEETVARRSTGFTGAMTTQLDIVR